MTAKLCNTMDNNHGRRGALGPREQAQRGRCALPFGHRGKHSYKTPAKPAAPLVLPVKQTDPGLFGYSAPPEIVQVSPEMATKWLEGNTHNRPINQETVNRYARDMAAGRWKVTHQAIAWDKDGRLVDGQHRLWAILQSGATVPLLVIHGLDISAQTVIDTGLSRSTWQRLSLSDRFGDVTPKEANVLRWLVKGISKWERYTPEEEQDQFAKHRDAIRFAIAAFPGKRGLITVAPVYAVVARSFYLRPQRHDDIKRFCYVLFTGERKAPGEALVCRMRDLLLSSSGDKAMKPHMIYAKVEWTLRSFLDGKSATRIIPITTEVFPLPGETTLATTRPAQAVRRFDNVDRVMKAARAYREAGILRFATSDLSKTTGLATTPARLACIEACNLGWLEGHGRENVRGKSSYVYSLAPEREA